MSSAMLAYYSHYFAPCFNPEYGFKQVHEGVSRRPEDYPIHVNSMVEYMKYESSSIWVCERYWAVVPFTTSAGEVWEVFYDYIMVCGKYDFTEACCIIVRTLGKALGLADMGI